MITIIFGLFVILMLIFVSVSAIEYRKQYEKRMDIFALEDEFVGDFCQVREMLPACTKNDAQKLIKSFQDRWTGIIDEERVHYFVQQMNTTADLRMTYSFHNN